MPMMIMLVFSLKHTLKSDGQLSFFVFNTLREWGLIDLLMGGHTAICIALCKVF